MLQTFPFILSRDPWRSKLAGCRNAQEKNDPETATVTVQFKTQINSGTTEYRQCHLGNYHFSVKRNKAEKKKWTLQEIKRLNKEAYGEFGAGGKRKEQGNTSH